MTASPIELVVAHHRENLNWLRNIPCAVAVSVYDKDFEAQHSGSFQLPNIGREAHTYLHHLVTRYDSLSEWTVFCQGKPFDHACNFHQSLKTFVADPDRRIGFSWLGHLIDTDDWQGHRLFKHWSKNEDGRGLDLARFHQTLFGIEGPSEFTFVLGAQFGVSRNVVRSQSLEFYRNALEASMSFPDAAHCFERMWDRVFGQVGIDAQWLAGRKTVLLKPMKYQSETLPDSNREF